MNYSSLPLNEELLNNTDNKQEEPLIMAEPINEEEMPCTQMSQVLGGQDTNIFKTTAMADAQKKHRRQKKGDESKHQRGEITNRIISSRISKRLKEPKLLSRNKAMDKQVSEEDEAWLSSRTEAQLDLLISIQKMAMERAKTIQDKHVNGIFNFKLLRTIGVLLEEFAKERLKNALSPGDVVETPTVPPENNGERISSRKDRDCNHIEPIVKVESEEMTATDLTNQKCNYIKPIVKVELEETTATDMRKRKRNASCEGGDVHTKKRKKKRHHTMKAEI